MCYVFVFVLYVLEVLGKSLLKYGAVICSPSMLRNKSYHRRRRRPFGCPASSPLPPVAVCAAVFSCRVFVPCVTAQSMF